MSEKGEELRILPNCYLLSVDAEKDKLLDDVKIGNGVIQSKDDLYGVHIGHLSKKLVVRNQEKILKRYDYRDGNLLIRGEAKKLFIDSTFLAVINESLDSNIKIGEPTIAYAEENRERNAIVFVDCGEVITDYSLFPFKSGSTSSAARWSQTYAQIARKTYSKETFEVFGNKAQNAYYTCEEQYNQFFDDDVVYIAFCVNLNNSRLPISMLTYEPKSKLMHATPVLFGASWSNNTDCKIKTMVFDKTWDSYINDISKKFVAPTRNKILDWGSLDRAWMNSRFDNELEEIIIPTATRT